MTISQKGIDLIKKFEGLRLKAYKDSGGIYTIGYGHTGEEAQPGNIITYKEAEILLRKDLQYAIDSINSINIELTQNQFDALCSLVYNMGFSRLVNRYSYLFNMIKANPYNEKIIALWEITGIKDKRGKIIKGLQLRRKLETQLYSK